MDRSSVIVKSPRNGRMIAAIVIAILGFAGGFADAAITLDPGSLGISAYQLDGLAPSNSFGPVFSNGMLLAPGGGFPTLTGTVPETPTQLSIQTPISTNFITNATTNPNSPIGYVPASFGTATTDILATVVGGNGTSSSRGGIFWNSDTTLADNLAGSSNMASVSVSTAMASFTNSGTTAIDIKNPGAFLSVTGSLGSATSSYVAAGLSSSFTVSGGGLASVTTVLGSISLAANRSGASFSSNGGGSGASSARLINGLLSATGSSTNTLGDIMLQPGQSIAFNATLTLISDPGSSITISTDLAPGFPSDPQYIPGFGVFAGGPDSLAVPEPSTIVLLGAGLVSAGLWGRRRSSAAAGPGSMG